SHLEKQKQDNEMKIARDVQRALLPEHLPEIDGYTFFASYESAQAVGGDYYDCLQIDDSPLMCLAFGDVAGKGVPAALVMSRLSSIVQSTLDFVRDVGEAAARINRHMCSNAIEGRFVTFVLAFVDTRTNRLSFVNAGHMAPLIRKPDGTVLEIGEDSVGLPLGVIEDYPYDTIECTLEPGETVVIYTDGVSEAMNPDGSLYGIERIKSLVAGQKTDSAAIGRAILDDVKKHANGRPQNDDITLMSFGRSAEGRVPTAQQDTVRTEEIQNALQAR
ncbi:MAG TPA: PP2C family protein-serine/threonine phosphatase, partial [Planctomycetaceae bacterium]|nr:PP2C family protein-serine/threonine phosphatase [Planctomycetaceae bacterium]